MTTETTIPADILAMMEAKKIEVRKQIAEREEAKARELDELKTKGTTLFNEWIEKSLADVPEWLREYFDRAFYKWEDDDFVRLGRGHNNIPDRLYFSIPGLATVEQDPQNKKFKSSWAWWSGEEEGAPELQFRRDCMEWRDDLAYVLCEAEKQFQKHQENLFRWGAAKEQALAEYNRREASDQKAEERAREIQQARAEQKARDEQEELYTFDVLKNDAVAMHLVKAFLLIQNERSHFEQRLQDADETMYSIEERWSRRAEDLRRQADEADRRAADERSRLQDDLDDVEAKLKKAERAARSW